MHVGFKHTPKECSWESNEHRKSVRRVQAGLMGVTSPNMGVLYPLLPFGTPPPLGIEFAPPKMLDMLFHKGANRAFMKTPLEKSLSLALT